MLHPGALSPVAFSFKIGLLRGEQAMQVDSNDTLSERAELHFLAALVDELMRELLVSGVLSQAQLNEIEQQVSRRVGHSPRAW